MLSLDIYESAQLATVNDSDGCAWWGSFSCHKQLGSAYSAYSLLAGLILHYLAPTGNTGVDHCRTPAPRLQECPCSILQVGCHHYHLGMFSPVGIKPGSWEEGSSCPELEAESAAVDQ